MQHVNVSIGIAFSNRAYENANELLRDADTAMYRAKSNGMTNMLCTVQGCMSKRWRISKWRRNFEQLQNGELGVAYRPFTHSRIAP